MSPAAVETAVYANEPAWHKLGTVLDTKGDRGITVPIALKKSGLDWEVEKCEIFGPQRQLIEGRWGVQRQTDQAILGVVGDTWEPVQNTEGFQIITDVIEQAGGLGTPIWIESAGSLMGGRKVWVLAHIDIGLQIAGEKYASYLLFTNGHDGRTSVTAAALDVRVVCQNTLDYGLSEARESGRIVRVRHTVKASERIQEAHAILGMRNVRAEELAQQAEWLLDHDMDEGEFNNFLETLMPIPEGQEGKPAETMINGRRDKVRGIYMGAPNLQPIRDTTWGAFQAVLEYCDHGREFKTQESQAKAQMGITNQPLKQSAYNLAVAFALKD